MNGQKTTEVPYQMMKAAIEPVYTSLPGWKTDITAIQAKENIPQLMKNYIEHVNNYLGVGISYVSNGPGREQIIRLK
jgi:adenylosuccinate synthase